MLPQSKNNFPPVNNPVQQGLPRKHTRLILLTIVMILVGVLAVIYFWYQESMPSRFSSPNLQNKKVVSQTTSQSIDQSAAKQILRYEKYNLELELPTEIEVFITDYTDIDWSGPGGHWQNLAKTVWEERLKNKDSYDAGENCKEDTASSFVKKCIILRLEPYVIKEFEEVANGGVRTNVYYITNDFDLRISKLGELSDAEINMMLLGVRVYKGLNEFSYKNITLTYALNSNGSLSVFTNNNGVKNKLFDATLDGYEKITDQRIFYKTSLPNTVKISSGKGDAGEYTFHNYYLNLDTNKYIGLTYSSNKAINIKTSEGKDYTIDFVREDTCKSVQIDGAAEGVSRLEGKMRLLGLRLNNALKYPFTEPIDEDCDRTGNSGEYIATVGLKKDFSKVFFYFTSPWLEYVDKKEYFSFDPNTLEITKENPSDLLDLYWQEK